MRIDIDGKRVIVKETGSKNNKVIYDNTEDISNYNRRNLSIIEEKLIELGEVEDARVINDYLGRILKVDKIPEVIPTSNYRINTRIRYLKEAIDKYIEEYGLNLHPDFQRGNVWEDHQRIKYVEFILQGGKSNPIYFNHPDWMGGFEGEMVIVDGKQRLTSLLMFLNDGIRVFKELDPDGKGFYVNELDYLPYDIEIVINNLKTREQVLEWYLQMNRGNIAHTQGELEKVEKLLEKERRK